MTEVYSSGLAISNTKSKKCCEEREAKRRPAEVPELMGDTQS